MLTQLRQARVLGLRERQITLEVHPDIQLKLKMNHFLQKRRPENKNESPNEQQNKKQEANEKNMEKQNSSLYYSKYEPQNLPKKTKKPVKMSSYQIYKQQQKSLRLNHQDKRQQWKKNNTMKRSSLKTRNESREYLQTRTFSQRRKNVQITFNLTEQLKIFDNHLIRKMSPNNIKLSYSNTHSNSPNCKNINLLRTNMTNYKKIHFKHKSHLQFKPFQTIPHPLSHRQKPSPSTLQLTSSRNLYIKSSYSQRKNSESLNNTTLNSFRKTITSKMKTKNRDNLFDHNSCRPWSGNKGQNAPVGDYSVFYL